MYYCACECSWLRGHLVWIFIFDHLWSTVSYPHCSTLGDVDFGFVQFGPYELIRPCRWQWSMLCLVCVAAKYLCEPWKTWNHGENNRFSWGYFDEIIIGSIWGRALTELLRLVSETCRWPFGTFALVTHFRRPVAEVIRNVVFVAQALMCRHNMSSFHHNQTVLCADWDDRMTEVDCIRPHRQLTHLLPIHSSHTRTSHWPSRILESN